MFSRRHLEILLTGTGVSLLPDTNKKYLMLSVLFAFPVTMFWILFFLVFFKSI
jgi:hypothetical protein